LESDFDNGRISSRHMPAKILDGKKVAARVREDVTRDVAEFIERTGDGSCR
jgi:hypothetical protein